MKLHNPFESHNFLTGYFAVLSVVIVILAIGFLFPYVFLGIPLIPVIYTIRYMFKGE